MEVNSYVRRWRAEECAVRMPVSPPGSRSGYWLDDCPVHGHTSFNTIINGCEQCAANRIAGEDKAKCQPPK